MAIGILAVQVVLISILLSFSNKDKTHGYMFDEILYEIYKNQVDINDPNISSVLRNLFTSNLSPLYSYDFVIIHHEINM